MIGRNRIKTIVSVPVLQWANGRTVAQSQDNAGTFESFVGWHIEVGQHAMVDEAAQKAAIPIVHIRHQRQGGEGAAVVRHWNLGPHIRLFPLTRGPVVDHMAAAAREDAKAEIADSGMVMRWDAQSEHQTDRSYLAVRGYVQFLAPDRSWVLIPALVQATVRARMTDAFLAALVDHLRVCEQADAFLKPDRRTAPITMYELALPLEPGEEEVWGKRQTAPVIPMRSARPQTITREYLQSMWRPQYVADAALRDWDAVRAWAAESMRICTEDRWQRAGEDKADSHSAHDQRLQDSVRRTPS